MRKNRLGLLDFFIIFFGSAWLTVGIKRALLSLWAHFYENNAGRILGSLWVQDGLFFVGILLFLAWRKEDFQSLGWQPLKKKNAVFRAILCGMALYLLMVAMTLIINALLPNGLSAQSVTSYMSAQDSWPERLLVWLTMGVLAPIVEELLFRGYLYHSFCNYFSPALAMVFTSLFFGLSHMDLERLLPLALGGLLLNLIAVRQQSVKASAISHGAWNTLMIIAYYSAI